jgi:hypothetical protein
MSITRQRRLGAADADAGVVDAGVVDCVVTMRALSVAVQP